MKKKHIGSSFDDFLKEEGRLEEATAVAIKRVIAWQLQKEMKKKNISQIEMAKQLKTSKSALKRLLDPDNPSVTLLTLSRVAVVLGKELKFSFA